MIKFNLYNNMSSKHINIIKHNIKRKASIYQHQKIYK